MFSLVGFLNIALLLTSLPCVIAFSPLLPHHPTSWIGPRARDARSGTSIRAQPAAGGVEGGGRADWGGWVGLKDWAQGRGVAVGDWSVGVNRGVEEDRGVFATNRIEAGGLLAVVPTSTSLVATEEPPTLPSSFINKGYWRTPDASSSDKGWVLKLAVQLLHTRAQGPDAALAPYLAVLPEKVPTLMEFPDDLLAELQWPPLVERIKQEREWMAAAFSTLRPFLQTGSQKTKKKEKGKGQKGFASKPEIDASAVHAEVTFEDFRWALGCVRSRSFTDAGRWAMCPCADLFNHGRAGQGSSLTFLPTGGEGGGEFRLFAGQAIDVGEQVEISYGELDNSHLLAFYGFAEDDNAYDVVSVPSSILASVFRSVEETGDPPDLIWKDATIHLVPDASEGEDVGGEAWLRRGAVVDALRRYKYLGEESADKCRLFRGGVVSPDLEMLLRAWTLPEKLLLSPGAASALAVAIGEGAPIAPEAERAAVAAKAELARALLQGLFPSSLASDLDELDKAPLGSRHAMLLRFRVSKKRLLAEMS